MLEIVELVLLSLLLFFLFFNFYYHIIIIFPTDGRSCSYFNDNVLKQLPDVRTLINVRQSLLSTGRNAATCTSKGNCICCFTNTRPESKLNNSPHSTDPDAADDFELIPDLIYLLTLYQKLSPVLLYQADFNLASLVYELNDVSAASPVINHTLSLLLDAPPESLKKLMKVRPLHELLCIPYAYIITCFTYMGRGLWHYSVFTLSPKIFAHVHYYRLILIIFLVVIFFIKLSGNGGNVGDEMR